MSQTYTKDGTELWGPWRAAYSKFLEEKRDIYEHMNAGGTSWGHQFPRIIPVVSGIVLRLTAVAKSWRLVIIFQDGSIKEVATRLQCAKASLRTFALENAGTIFRNNHIVLFKKSRRRGVIESVDMENLSFTIEGYPDNTVPFNEWNSGYEVLSKEDLITRVCKDLKIVLFGIHNRMQQSLFISGTRHDVLTGIIEIERTSSKAGDPCDVTTVVDGKRRVQKRLSYECIRQHMSQQFYGR